MPPSAIAEAQQQLRDSDIQWIHGQFVDLLGTLRSLSMPVQRYLNQDIWHSGVGFDGSSVHGFSSVEQSDMVAIPDPTTLQPIPWLYGGSRARVTMDIATVDTHQPYQGDPRHIARRAGQAIQQHGYDAIHLSPEYEFHLLPTADHDTGEPQRGVHDPDQMNGYFAAVPHDSHEPFRNHLCSILHDTAPVKYHHHEGGTWQHEIEIHPLQGPVQAGDVTVYFKFLARALAAMQNLHVTFMPKPVQGDAGSGMHVHLELLKDGASVFHDPDDERRLSQEARYFIGGLLDHAPALTAITNPTVNSYKRLVPHYEAPIHVAWGSYNRSSLIRIPRHADTDAMDIEIRHPDATANPYLAVAVLIHAGLDGIQHKTAPGPAIDENIYQMDTAELTRRGISRLPTSLHDALEALQSDSLIQTALGDHAYNAFLDLKQRECSEYAKHVTRWERDRYLGV